MERLGLRCSVDVFEEVTEKASSSAQYRKDIVEARDRRDIDNARTALMHLFPRIPIAVAEAILLHGFEKGSGRVGRTGTIESDEKVTLAVIAYARHNFTPYEEHIREFRRGMEGNKAKPLAREAIRDQLQEVLTAWRSSNVSVIPSSLKEAKKKHEVKTRPTKGAKTSRHRPTISTPKKRTAMKKKSANGAPRERLPSQP
ncbi:MAG: hypothetical protein LQ340_002130 [Diploschistes diacapsis]|nr:MAG: hypothetical protein LQ340_002130 [Diploschistes diacapsis]